MMPADITVLMCWFQTTRNGGDADGRPFRKWN